MNKVLEELAELAKLGDSATITCSHKDGAIEFQVKLYSEDNVFGTTARIAEEDIDCYLNVFENVVLGSIHQIEEDSQYGISPERMSRLEFSNLIRNFLEKTGYSYYNLAQELKTGAGTISRWMYGHSAPPEVARKGIEKRLNEILGRTHG